MWGIVVYIYVILFRGFWSICGLYICPLFLWSIYRVSYCGFVVYICVISFSLYLWSLYTVFYLALWSLYVGVFILWSIFRVFCFLEMFGPCGLVMMFCFFGLFQRFFCFFFLFFFSVIILYRDKLRIFI